MKKPDGELERSIPMENSEFRAYRAVYSMTDMTKRLLAGILEEFMEGQLDREREMWDQAAQKCGFNTHDELLASGRFVSIDLATRQVKLFKR